MSDNIDLKAFDDGGADQLLRETMQGYRVEPKPGLWKGISRKLLWRELVHFNLTNLSPKLWIAGSVGLLLVATALYYGLPGGTSGHEATKSDVKIVDRAVSTAGTPVTESSIHPVTGIDQKSTENTVVARIANQDPSIGKSTKTLDNKEQRAMAPAPEMKNKPVATLAMQAVTPSVAQDEMESVSTHSAGLSAIVSITHMSPYEAAMLPTAPGVDTIITVSNSAGTFKFRKTTSGAMQFFSGNLGIAPEMAFYSAPENYYRANFWVNAGVTWHISRFSIASGFGVGYVYDEGKYVIGYKSRDSVGYFNEVTSYSIGTHNDIIYNTKTVNVYDSLQHAAGSQTKNQYSYLQVPLLLGYRFFESNSISLTFQAGPAISVLLGSRKPAAVFDNGNATITSVDNNTPSRIQTNWQVWANLYMEMRLNKKISIYMEPTFKYYLNPMVTQENVIFKAPLTVGLGVGIQFNFGQKKTSP